MSFQFLQEALFPGFCTANNDAVAVWFFAGDFSHSLKKLQLAFPPGNAPGHHENMFVLKLWELGKQRLSPCFTQCLLLKVIHIHSALYHSELLLGNLVVVGDVVAYTV